MTPQQAVAHVLGSGLYGFGGRVSASARLKIADSILAAIEATGHRVVPVKPNDQMLDELGRIGDGPMISGAEVWGYMLAAAISSGTRDA